MVVGLWIVIRNSTDEIWNEKRDEFIFYLPNIKIVSATQSFAITEGKSWCNYFLLRWEASDLQSECKYF